MIDDPLLKPITLDFFLNLILNLKVKVRYIWLINTTNNFVMFTRNLVIHIIKMLQSIFVFAAKVPSVGGEYGFSLELHSVISLQ